MRALGALLLLAALAASGRAAATEIAAAAGAAASAQCGRGIVGSGTCSSPADCCSEFGDCGRNASHCGFGCQGGPCWEPAELVRFYVDLVPAEALGLGGSGGSSDAGSGADTASTPPPSASLPPAPPKAPALAVVEGPVYGSLQMTPARKRRAVALSNVFEASRTEPQYGYCEYLGGTQGIAFGFAGFATGATEGAAVVKDYCQRKPAAILCPFQPTLEATAASGSSGNITGLEAFCVAVRRAAVEAAFIEAQQAVHDELYWQPLLRAVAKLGIKLPLTIAAYYDTVAQHGLSAAATMADFASTQLDGTPGEGVDEKQWLQAFLACRRQVLYTPGKADAWASSARRVDVLWRLASEAQCWTLDGPITVSNRKPYSGCWVQDGYYGSQYIA